MSPVQRRRAVSPTVFLGLVTHRATRFPESASTDGLVQRLADALTARGISSIIDVHTENHYDPGLVPLTQTEVVASITAELALENRWRQYVRPRSRRVPLSLVMAARRLYRRTRLAPPWRTSSTASEAGGRMLRRLVNIELAHLHLIARALESGATWALIVEDDAQLADPDGFADGIAHFMDRCADRSQPAYVNVSRSFRAKSLGISEHLTDVGPWSASIRCLASDRPLTNTVCAVLYRSSFLTELNDQMAAIPMSPVLPIDWKLNAALLAMYETGSLGPGDCWFLEPAPISQGSMHEAAD